MEKTGKGGEDEERDATYPLFICEMKDELLSYLQAGKQSRRLLQRSRNLYDLPVPDDSKWWGAQGWIRKSGRQMKSSACIRWMPQTHVFQGERQYGMKEKWFTHTYTKPHRLTFRRQAFVTTCLGSTTSTRGSLMATLRMQLMSKPYTFSHPVHAHNRNIWGVWIFTFWIFVQSSDLSGKEGCREGKTKCLTQPGSSPALTQKHQPSWKQTLATSNSSAMSDRLFFSPIIIRIWTSKRTKLNFPPPFPLSLHLVLSGGRNTQSKRWEGGICHWYTEKLKIKACKGLGWLNSFGFIWEYVIEQRRPPAQ